MISVFIYGSFKGFSEYIYILVCLNFSTSMSGVKAVFRSWFGSLEFEFSNAEELREKLNLVKMALEEVSSMGFRELLKSELTVEAFQPPISKSFEVVEKTQQISTSNLLDGLVEWTVNGPVIIAPEKAKLSQYEAIALLLYASKEQKADPKTIALLLQSSGFKVSNVSARLKEMAENGRVFKPDPKDVLWKLSAQGQMWVEKAIIPKIRGGIV